jgi:hypothetical protein
MLGPMAEKRLNVFPLDPGWSRDPEAIKIDCQMLHIPGVDPNRVMTISLVEQPLTETV